MKQRGDWGWVERTLVNRRTRSLLSAKSLSGIQGVGVAAVEGVRADYGDEENDQVNTPRDRSSFC